MASDGQLPDTDDPFELLGVDPDDDDDRAVRRAYARLIKLHRPDRAPEAFARIHRAFEIVSAIQAARARATVPDDEAASDATPATRDANELGAAAPEPTTAPTAGDGPEAHAPGERRPAGGWLRVDPQPRAAPPPRADDDPVARTHARIRAVAAALGGEDDDALDATVADALDAGVPLDVLIGVAPSHQHDRVLCRRAITWARLRAGTAAAIQPVMLAAAVDARFTAGDLDGATALLAEPDLAAAAASAPLLAGGALRALAALAWRGGDAAALVDRFRALPPDPDVARWLARTDVEVAAAAALRRPGLPTLPGPLLDLLREDLLAPAARRLALTDVLARDLRETPARYLGAFDALDAAAPDVATALADRLSLDVPPPATELRRMPEPLFRAVSTRVRAAGRRFPLYWPVIAVVVFLAAGYAQHHHAGGVMAIILGLGAAFALFEVATVYRRLCRVACGSVLVDLAMPRRIVDEWIARNNQLSGMLGMFSGTIQRDRGLYLLGLAAAFTAEINPTWQRVFGGE